MKTLQSTALAAAIVGAGLAGTTQAAHNINPVPKISPMPGDGGEVFVPFHVTIDGALEEQIGHEDRFGNYQWDEPPIPVTPIPFSLTTVFRSFVGSYAYNDPDYTAKFDFDASWTLTIGHQGDPAYQVLTGDTFSRIDVFNEGTPYQEGWDSLSFGLYRQDIDTVTSNGAPLLDYVALGFYKYADTIDFAADTKQVISTMSQHFNSQDPDLFSSPRIQLGAKDFSGRITAFNAVAEGEESAPHIPAPGVLAFLGAGLAASVVHRRRELTMG